MQPFVVRRSAWRMWGIAIGGVPLFVIALDVLTQRRLTDVLRALLFRPDDTQLLEPRDVIWAWAMLAVGAALTLWGLKELIAPTAMVRADADGLALKINGPFRPPLRLSWDQVDDVGSGTVEDAGDELPVLWVRLMRPEDLPDDAWGGRPIDDRTLALLASDWDETPTAAARRITEVALASVRSPEVDQA